MEPQKRAPISIRLNDDELYKLNHIIIYMTQNDRIVKMSKASAIRELINAFFDRFVAPTIDKGEWKPVKPTVSVPD